MSSSPGIVYLVGAGPGDPGLITVKGRELLRAADVILYDRLVSSVLLSEAKIGAELVDVGKAPGGRATSQGEINQLLIEKARLSAIVVRLKGGDPFVFGRGGEELAACRAAGISCIVVPGVSSAIAAPASAGIPVTHRGEARSLVVITGRTEDAAALPPHDYEALAKIDTIILMMGRANLADIARRLQEAGRDPLTPAACISEGTTPRQQIVTGTLATIAEEADRAELPSPMVTIVGETVTFATEQAAWLERIRADRPLTGRRIAVTQAASTASTNELPRGLTEAGAHIVHCPMIEITHPAVAPELDDAITTLDEFNWIVFTSLHGVRGFWHRLSLLGRDARALGRCKVAAVGPGTSRELESKGILADLVPPLATAESLVDAMKSVIKTSGGEIKVLFPRGDLALPTVPNGLRTVGARVIDPIVYLTKEAALTSAALSELRAGVDAILFCSPSAVRGFASMHIDLGNAVIGCIGPTTAAAARDAGLPVDVVPDTPGSAHLIAALSAHFQNAGVRT